MLTIIGLLANPQIASGQSVLRVGIKERVMVFSYLLWAAVLAVSLFRASSPSRLSETPVRHLKN